MVVVEELDEGLDPGSPLDLLLAHVLGHLAWVTVNAGHEGVAVWTVRAPIIVILREGKK